MSQNILETARKTFLLEAEAIKSLSDSLDQDFESVVSLISTLKGRVVISGIGKSALVAQKIVATLNSTGTPSLFLHAADALHGDLGMVQEGDAVIIISNSGSSPEIKALVPLIKHFGNPLIAFVGNTHSFLAKHADYILNTMVSQEACPNNLAPTSSTTAQMVMGDALAISLMEVRGFREGDYAKFHPGGTLGKKLYLRVSDVYTDNEKPAVLANQSLKEVIVEMTRKRLGVAAVVTEDRDLIGIITDGDLRRMLERNADIENIAARDIMTLNPKTIGGGELAVTALDMMRKNSITQLIVTEEKKYLGVIHIHDLLKEGLI